MATLVIKNLADTLHARLKRQAKRNHRSLNKETVRLIETALAAPMRPVEPLPPPLKLRGGPITTAQIERAIANGRE